MERNAWIGKSLILLAFLASPAVSGDTVLAPQPKAEKLAPGESYPESRFGRPPAKVDTGVTPGLAARETEAMDAGEDASDLGGGSRSPASLQPEGSKPAAAQIGIRAELKDPPAASTVEVETRKGVQEVALIAGDLGYFPKTVFVARDVPVRMFITGASKNTLCIMMDSFQVRKQVRSQKIEEVTFTPNVPGKYRFYCPVNGMEGTLIVKELAGILPASAASRSTASE